MDRNADDSAGLGLLASALAGRVVRVEAGGDRDAAWTDGACIHLRLGDDPAERRVALAVQAALLAAGSLAPEIMRKLGRRPALARRYLAFEAPRAVAAIADLLPPTIIERLHDMPESASASPADSLALARAGTPAPPLPDRLGMLRPRAIKADAIDPANVDETATKQSPANRRDAKVVSFAGDDADDQAPDLDLSNGRGGPLGKLIQWALRYGRQAGGNGPVGADAPTHMLATAPGGARPGARIAARVDAAGIGGGRARGARYPEWDGDRRRYRADWCTVQEPAARSDPAVRVPQPRSRPLRRPLSRLALGIDSVHRQRDGDDIDLDAAIEARIAALAGATGGDDVYIAGQRRRRDLSVLVLLDVSGSAREPAALGGSVHEQQLAAAAALVGALHDLGDRVALYAFRSQGRSAVSLTPIKTFEETLNTAVLRRLHSIEPGGYSRLGAAIRHGSAVLADRGGTQRRLLVVLSDGLAYDHGYELDYGAADAAHALAEARGQAIGCLCLSVGATTDAGALRRVFGSAAHASVPAADRMDRSLAPLFRSALRSAEGRRGTAHREREAA